MKSRLLLDVVVAQSATILELLAGEDQALLVGGNAIGPRTVSTVALHVSYSYAPLLVLDLGLDIVDGVRRLDLKGDGFAREAVNEVSFGCFSPLDAQYIRLDENLHSTIGWRSAIITGCSRRSMLTWLPPLSVQRYNDGVVDKSTFRV